MSALAMTGLGLGTASASTATTTDVRVTPDTDYVKANGRMPNDGDAIKLCGTDLRQQNEPSTAVNPNDTRTIVGGSNEYCTIPGAGGTWAGFYRSTDSGKSFTGSLLPGYPTDDSPEGKASPLQQRGIGNAGDPVQAWDNNGRLFYMGNAFNRLAPQNGSVWVATYDANATNYVRTVIVGRGTPAPQGKFNDKTAIEVDRGKSTHAGNVYAAWSVFQGSGNNEIVFARSTDHGKTFSHPTKLSEGVKDNQFADIAVTSNGTVYIAWRQFASKRGQQRDAVVYAKSTNGGASFTKPAVAKYFEAYDAADTAGAPAAAAAAHTKAYRNADGPEAEAGDASVGDSRDCGSGPFACKSGFVFFRHASQPRITADPKAKDQNVYLVYDATIPGTEQASQTTYNTADPVGSTLRVGQGGLFFSKLTGGTSTWSPSKLLDGRGTAGRRGHQFFGDINADGGVLHAVWHDSRKDPAYSVQYPPGDNGAVRDAGRFATATAGLDTYAASSRDSGTSWAETRLSGASQKPNYEMFGDRQVPFHGDYNYVSSVGGFAYNVWTDTREVRPGDDPRFVGGESFDVFQCRAKSSSGTYGKDKCPSAGGLDQDIFGAASTG